MTIDVTVLRVFTDPDGNFGNPLGVVDADAVGRGDRQRIATQLGYSETIFVDHPSSGSHTARIAIYTPTSELAFAGHPTVGASWWLRSLGSQIHTLQVPAGIVTVDQEGDLTSVRARAEWGPEFALHELGSPDDVLRADLDDYPDDVAHYIWAWIDKEAGRVRARMFAPELGVAEDEATGAAALRLTDFVSRDLTIIQGKGSIIETTWHGDGWVRLAGRVVNDSRLTIE